MNAAFYSSQYISNFSLLKPSFNLLVSTVNSALQQFRVMLDPSITRQDEKYSSLHMNSITTLQVLCLGGLYNVCIISTI